VGELESLVNSYALLYYYVELCTTVQLQLQPEIKWEVRADIRLKLCRRDVYNQGCISRETTSNDMIRVFYPSGPDWV
jgi:hypothetical protein